MNETNEALATRSPGSVAVELPHSQKMIDETNEALAT